jgi:hypothetical protein
VDELAGINAPSTYVNGLVSYGNNVSTVYNDSGIVAAGSYAATSWNVGAVWSGTANIDLATGEAVGDWYQRGAEISGGVASTAGVASGGVSLFNWATTPAATAPAVAAPAESGGLAYRVMSQDEFTGAQAGKYSDGSLFKNPDQLGNKWVWPTQEQAAQWQALMQAGGEDPIITQIPTRNPLTEYPAYPHGTPPGPAYLVPIEHMGPAVPVK